MRLLVRVAFASCVVYGCSLSNVDQLELRECASDEDCQPLNDIDRIEPAACLSWQCNTQRACELRLRDDDDDGDVSLACGGTDCDDTNAAARLGNAELCDGVDNDCNGLVDDGDEMALVVPVVLDVPDPEWATYSDGRVAYAAGDGAGFDALDLPPVPASRVVYARDSDFGSAEMVPGCHTRVAQPAQPPTSEPVGTTTTTCQTHADCDDGTLCNGFETCEPLSPDADPLTGCRDTGAAACPAGFVCDEEAFACVELNTTMLCEVAELAVSTSFGEHAFAAAINTVGCSAGQVRVGLFDTAQREFRIRGDERRSTAWPAIDVEANCSGASREGALGATLPAIAALDADVDSGRRRPQALVAWLADCHYGGCTDSIAVEVLALWEEQGTAGGEPVRWVHAANDGVPIALDPISTRARPALAATADGFLLAYAAKSGGISIRFVPPSADPEEVIDMEPHRTRIDPAGAARRSDPLVLPDATFFGRMRQMRDVVVAPGATDGADRWIGLAWRESDGVYYSPLRYRDGVFSEWRPIRLSDGVGVEPAIVWSPSGIVGSTYGRDGEMALEETGGWAVTWVAEGEVRLSRVAAFDRRVVGTRVRRLGGVEPRAAQPYVGPEGRLHLAYHDGGARSFVRTNALCGPGL